MTGEGSTDATDIVIRPARSEDLDALHAIELQSHPQPWTRHALETELHQPGRRLLVACVRGEPLAYVVMWRIVDEAQIQNVTTAERARNQGVARALLAAALDEAAQQGCVRATLEVRPQNAAARALYVRLGFVETGSRPRFYSNGDAAILMEKALA